LIHLIPVVVLFGVVLGGMFSGWFTVNQASAIGAAVACIITVVRGRFTWAIFKKVMAVSVQTSAMTFLIMVGAAVFVTFLNITGLPKALATNIAGLDVSKYVIILLMTLIYLMIGMIMDELPAILMTVPIFLPIVVALGYDPIWFGVYIVLNCELGAISPPVGLTCFILSGIAKDVPLGRIFRGAMPFAATVFLMIALITVFPSIATFLPNLLFDK
jgi:tripartite ATP-independent transporter DctM subunit